MARSSGVLRWVLVAVLGYFATAQLAFGNTTPSQAMATCVAAVMPNNHCVDAGIQYNTGKVVECGTFNGGSYGCTYNSNYYRYYAYDPPVCGSGASYSSVTHSCRCEDSSKAIDSQTGACVTPPTCSTGYHWPGTGNICVQDTCDSSHEYVEGLGCIAKPTCGAGTHDNGSGQCVQDTCSNNQHYVAGTGCVDNPTCDVGYHNNIGGDGSCVKDQCTLGKVWVAGQGCVDPPPVQCSSGYHDNGSGTCIPDTDCNTNPTATGCSPPPYCKQHPDDPFCSSPPPFCKAHPDDPTCSAPQPFCKLNPNDPACTTPPPYCSAHPTDPACLPQTPFCKQNPDDPACKAPNPYCKDHPDDPVCKTPNPYCVDHPNDPWCQSQTNPKNPYCVDHPTDPWCQSQTNPPKPYCVDHPDDPGCKSPTPYCSSHPDDPGCKSPNPFCKDHPDDPACQSPPPYCKQHPDDPYCAQANNCAQHPEQCTGSKDLCADHPDIAACQSHQSSGGNDCGAAPSCSGDAILCGTQMQAWAARCATEKMLGGTSEDTSLPGVDALMPAGGHGDWDQEVDTSGLDSGGLLSGGSCPLFPVVATQFVTLDFNSDSWCSFGQVIRGFVLVLAYFQAGRIIGGGR